jgi:hypothetical protein
LDLKKKKKRSTTTAKTAATDEKELEAVLAALARRGEGVWSVADNDIKGLLAKMGAMGPAKVDKRARAGPTKSSERRSDLPMRTRTRNYFRNPKASPKPEVREYGDVRLAVGRRGNAGSGRAERMLLSDLLIQKIPGGWTGMAAMPSGNI